MSRNLTKKEIEFILNDVDNKYKLEAYRTLSNLIISDKIKKSDLNLLKKNNEKFFKTKKKPRLLTQDELKYIVDVLPVTPSPIKEISLDNLNQIKKCVKKQLKGKYVVVNKENIEKIRKQIYNMYVKSQTEAGDSVGIMSAMAHSEPLSQSNLNTFHNVGQKSSAKSNTNNIEELFNLTVNRKINETITHFKDKNLTKEEIKDMIKILKGVSVETILNRSEFFDEIDKSYEYWYDNYETINGKLPNFVRKKHKFLRLYFNISSMFKYEILINEIIDTIKINTENQYLNETVYIVPSPSYLGIIDIHGNPEYIEYSVANLIKTGEKIGNCEKIKMKKDGSMPLTIEDSTTIFLEVILLGCLKSMIIKGIPQIEEIRLPPPITMLSTFNEIEIIDEESLQKYGNKKYGISLENFNRLWKISAKKNLLTASGIPIEKLINLFESANIKIIDKDEYNMVIFLPDREEELYYDEDDKVKKLYKLTKDGYYNNKNKELEKNIYKPKIFLQNKILFAENTIKLNINKNISEKNLVYKLPEYPDIYRYAFYWYAAIEGKGIIQYLMNNTLVDSKYTYPNNVNEVKEIFGIEAARYYLSVSYGMNDSISKITPSNTNLLVDFQTSRGVLRQVNSTHVAKMGNATFSDAAFEGGTNVFGKASAMGKVDDIKGISSCIMTGSKCKNGTGIVDVSENEKYIKNDKNKYPEKNTYVSKTKITSLKSGHCKSGGKLAINYDEPEGTVYMEENLDNELSPKLDIPEITKMKSPEEISIFLTEETVDIEDKEDSEKEDEKDEKDEKDKEIRFDQNLLNFKL